jgi:hypothetical protein
MLVMEWFCYAISGAGGFGILKVIIYGPLVCLEAVGLELFCFSFCSASVGWR